MSAPDDESTAADPTLADSEAEADVTRADRTRKREPPGSIEEGGPLVGDRYQVIKVLGRGGMGTVYLVEHQQLHKRFAMKVLPRYECDGNRAARFEREAKATTKIGHENIVNVTDFGRTTSGDYFLVMELLEGHDLAHELREVGKLSVRRSVAIARQLCRALGAAHDKGIVHRDLKPANIFLVSPRRDFIKILDFGLAKVEDLGEGRGITQEGTVMGTAQYMAPEQARGEPTDARSDIYALGCVLYEMLTGVAPFAAETFAKAIELQLTSTPRRPSELVETGRIPDALSDVVMQMLAKRPDNRYTSMHEVETALSLAADSSPSHKGPTPVEPARRTVRHVGLLLGGLLLAGAVALALDIHSHPTAAPAAPPVSVPMPVLLPVPTPSAPPPAPPTGPTLHLRSIPPDAIVTVDGAAVGATPLDVPLPPDRVLRIELDRQGYRRAQLTVSGNSELDREVTLIPLPRSKPKGAPTATPTAAPKVALPDLKRDPAEIERAQPPPPPPKPHKTHPELKNVLIE